MKQKMMKLAGILALGLVAVGAMAARVGTPVLQFENGNTEPMEFRKDYTKGVVYLASPALNVDLTNEATTTLFTQSQNTDFVPLFIVIRVKAASGVSVAAQISVGTNNDADNILPVTELTGLDSTGEAHVVSDLMTTAVVTNGSACKIKVTTGATATALDADVMILGTAL